jgi:hypothetical protein
MNPDLLRAKEAARRILAVPIRNVSLAAGGANSCIFRVETASELFALKAYPARESDLRRRANIEWDALKFLRGNGLTAPPRPIALDKGEQFLVMEWINGSRLERHSIADVSDSARFIKEIFALCDHPGAGNFPLASEACLSAAEIVRQIKSRITAFRGVPDVDSFIAEMISPRFECAVRNRAAEISTEYDLDPVYRRLIPADFGFHNALRQNDGHLRYIDFDYFGWDDPVKLTADFLLHPGMSLTKEEMKKFAAVLENALPADRDFSARLRRYLPLFAARWALILFNPFRPDRKLARGDGSQARAIQFAMQAAKARKVLAMSESMILDL